MLGWRVQQQEGRRQVLSFIVRYGAIAGLVVGVPLFLTFACAGGHPPGALGMLVGYLTMLIAFAAVFAGVKRYRDEALGGAIAFWPALALGLGISLVASLCYVIAWEAALAMTDTDFIAAYTETLVREKQAAGAGAAAIAELRAEMAAFGEQYRNPLYRMPITFTEIFPVGLLVSLVTAGLLRNRRFLPAR